MQRLISIPTRPLSLIGRFRPNLVSLQRAFCLVFVLTALQMHGRDTTNSEIYTKTVLSHDSRTICQTNLKGNQFPCLTQRISQVETNDSAVQELEQILEHGDSSASEYQLTGITEKYQAKKFSMIYCGRTGSFKGGTFALTCNPQRDQVESMMIRLRAKATSIRTAYKRGSFIAKTETRDWSGWEQQDDPSVYVILNPPGLNDILSKGKGLSRDNTLTMSIWADNVSDISQAAATSVADEDGPASIAVERRSAPAARPATINPEPASLLPSVLETPSSLLPSAGAVSQSTSPGSVAVDDIFDDVAQSAKICQNLPYSDQSDTEEFGQPDILEGEIGDTTANLLVRCNEETRDVQDARIVMPSDVASLLTTALSDRGNAVVRITGTNTMANLSSLAVWSYRHVSGDRIVLAPQQSQAVTQFFETNASRSLVLRVAFIEESDDMSQKLDEALDLDVELLDKSQRRAIHEEDTGDEIW